MYKIGQTAMLEKDYEVEHELYEGGKAYLKKGDVVIVLPNSEVEVQSGEYSDIIAKLEGFEAEGYNFGAIARDIVILSNCERRLCRQNIDTIISVIEDTLEMYFGHTK